MAESKLKELIFDDDQIVTYTRFSEQMNVHVNESKRVLWEFWCSNKENSLISATFVIMGQLPDNSDRIEVVEESDLSSRKEKYQKIYSEHIYSIQKSLKNLQMLALTQPSYTKFSSITCKESSLRLSQKTSNAQSIIKSTEPPKKSFESQKVVSVEAKSHVKTPEKEASKTPDSSMIDEKKEKVNKSLTVKEKSKKSSEKVSKKPVQSREAGFKSMFAKVADVNSKHLALQKEKEESPKNNTSTTENIDSQTEEETEKSIERKESSMESCKKEKIKKTNQKMPKKNGKRKVEVVKESNNTKKRRRIIAESDSSEEEEMEEADSNDFEEEVKENTISFENTEERKKSVNSPETNDRDGKQTIHKVEDVRFVDDDGFLVTKKVHVTTKVDVKKDVKKDRSPSPKKSKDNNVNKKQTKQSSLMSFFKKK
ncbi:DNA polymerase delta subunit 3-like [Leptopilina heterotoma]|uniref:DNA polymerase delta subunit 3-like n=1 Tax=Leptopilina heterotoma TaxID=63436 RepID=UPI001CA8FD5C|nr:DNA polymerase delta subunit 3-like [Leptopilina heterotoma]